MQRRAWKEELRWQTAAKTSRDLAVDDGSRDDGVAAIRWFTARAYAQSPWIEPDSPDVRGSRGGRPQHEGRLGRA